jgi:hypothetical protein
MSEEVLAACRKSVKAAGEKRASGIYVIRCDVTGDEYVGKSVNIPVRWYMHRYYLNDGRGVNLKLQAAWNAHGESAFSFRIWKQCGRQSLEHYEQTAINELHPTLNVHLNVSGGFTGRVDDGCERCGDVCRSGWKLCQRCRRIRIQESRSEDRFVVDERGDVDAMEREMDDLLECQRQPLRAIIARRERAGLLGSNGYWYGEV